MKTLYNILIALSIICPIVMVVLAFLMKDMNIILLSLLVFILTLNMRVHEKELKREKAVSFGKGYVQGYYDRGNEFDPFGDKEEIK